MTIPHPDELLAALDEDQQVVARQVTGPLAVRAGAGTGKTRAITYRLAYGVATQTYEPHNVLAVTFTKRAAQEMRMRLRDLGVGAVQARTFHSAALRQLEYFWPSAVGGYAPQLLERKASVVTAVAARLGIRQDKEAIRDFSAEIEWAKTSMIDAETYPESVRILKREVPGGLSSTQMASLMEAYERAKEERGVIDFGDVLLLTAGILEEREDIRRTVQAQYQHFVVDEYQDVSIVQQHLLDLWLGDRHNICVVGDVAQTIYTFAGASSTHLTQFQQRHPGARVVELTRDYRSTPQIVSIANSIVSPWGNKRSALQGAVRLISQRDNGPAVEFVSFAHDLAEANGVVDKIQDYLAQDGKPSNIAILYRINSQSEMFEHALAQAGISAIVRGGERFFERAEIRKALLALRRMILSQNEGHESLGKYVAEILTEVGWSEKPPSAGGALRESWDNLNALVELAFERDHQTLAQFMAEIDERIESQTAPTIEGVTLSTIHAAKGLEWDVVFLVGASEGLLPISTATTLSQREEERRLLYVGVTRARDRLVISWGQSRGDGSRPSRRQRSRLLDGIWPTERAMAQPAQKKPKTRSQSAQTLQEFEDEYGIEALQRFERLKAWRREIAADASVPAFTIFTDQTLRDIAVAQPQTLKQLRVIRGVGSTKLERFGGEVLRLIRHDEAELSTLQ